MKVEDCDFVAIPLQRLMQFSIAPYVVYMRIGQDHYAKILDLGDKVLHEKLRVWEGAGVVNLYLPKAIADFSSLELNGGGILADELRYCLKYLNMFKRCVDQATHSSLGVILRESFIVLEEIHSSKEQHFESYVAARGGLRHGARVAVLTLVLAKILNSFTPTTARSMCVAALLHDVGLVLDPSTKPCEIIQDYISDNRHSELACELYASFPWADNLVIDILKNHHSCPKIKKIKNAREPHPLVYIVAFADCFDRTYELSGYSTFFDADYFGTKMFHELESRFTRPFTHALKEVFSKAAVRRGAPANS
jgi:hypothetical protein